MKKILIFLTVILAVLLAIPLSISYFTGAIKTDVPVHVPGAGSGEVSEKTMKLLNTQSGEIKELSIEEYIADIMAAEIPAAYGEEALKAQAVATRSLLIYRLPVSAKKEGHGGADFCDNFDCCKAFKTDEEKKAAWGENYEKNSEKIADAVAKTKTEIMTFGGEAVSSLYFPFSAGKTETCADILGENLPYLISVDSNWDKRNPEYKSTVKINKADFFEKMKSAGETYTELPPDQAVGEISKTTVGGVKKITICNVDFDGMTAMRFFGLMGLNFELDYIEPNFIFTVYGAGHGVGMSQYGAEEMFKDGKTYREILSHYYTGVSFEKY